MARVHAALGESQWVAVGGWQCVGGSVWVAVGGGWQWVALTKEVKHWRRRC